MDILSVYVDFGMCYPNDAADNFLRQSRHNLPHVLGAISYLLTSCDLFSSYQPLSLLFLSSFVCSLPLGLCSEFPVKENLEQHIFLLATILRNSS